MSKVHLTKQAAAHRLLRTAATMYNRSDDKLAVHVIAASALQVLRDLVRHRGHGTYQRRAFAAGLYKSAKSKLAGEWTPSDGIPGADEIFAPIMKAIADGHVNGPDDIVVNMTRDFEHEMLDHISEPFNFLKHADRDPDGLIDENEIDVAMTLMHAICAYSLLFPGEQVPDEIQTFMASYETEFRGRAEL